MTALVITVLVAVLVLIAFRYLVRLLRGASTEELRQGLIRYRRLCAELLEQPVEQPPNLN